MARNLPKHGQAGRQAGRQADTFLSLSHAMHGILYTIVRLDQNNGETGETTEQNNGEIGETTEQNNGEIGETTEQSSRLQRDKTT